MKRFFPILAVVALILPSCIDDEVACTSGKEICFFIDDDTASPSQSNVTRSTMTDESPFATLGSLTGVIPTDDTPTGEKRYFHTFVSNIGGNSSVARNGSVSRGTPQNSIGSYGSFGIYGYVYSGEWTEGVRPEFMYNVNVCEREIINGKEFWKPASNYYWPEQGDKLRFFAYAPYNATGLTLPAPDVAGTPVLEYTVPASAADQRDLVAASSMEYGDVYKSPISLAFDHILTGIRFSVSSDMPKGTITKVLIKNVCSRGSYNMGTKQWTLSTSSLANFEQTVNQTVGDAEHELTSGNLTFMLMPQTLPANASIEVEYTEFTSKKVLQLKCDVAGTLWEPGKLITYRLSSSSIAVEPVISVSTPADVPYNGGKQTLKIDSYLLVCQSGQEVAKVPAFWKSEYFDETTGQWTSKTPAWGSVQAMGIGGMNGTVDVTVNPQTGEYVPSPHNLKMKGMPVLGSVDKPYNLASKQCDDKEGSTANCYVVNNPGYYKLPVVYGNGVKNNSKVDDCYKSKLSAGPNVLSTFVNAYGNPIKDSHIYHDCEKTLTDAVLLWQDVKGLVTDVKLSSNKEMLHLTIPADDTFQQGNAVVAVRDNTGMILWSWHIWVTDFVPEQPSEIVTKYDHNQTQHDRKITNLAGENYTLMGVPIGWVDGDIYLYKERSGRVRFKHTTGAVECEVTIKQLAQDLRTYRAPYFQWGRKDPIMPADVTRKINKETETRECYDANGNVVPYQSSSSQATVAEGIKNPLISYATVTNNHSQFLGWCSENFFNLWSLNDVNSGMVDTNVPVVKTIYDPSPRGYCLPPMNAFTGITYNGGDIKGDNPPSAGYINTPFKTTAEYNENMGFIFYCNRMPGQSAYDTSGGVWYMPSIGYRSEMNGSRVGLYYIVGSYHTASSGGEGKGFYAIILGGIQVVGNTEASANPRENTLTSNARAVIPVREYK